MTTSQTEAGQLVPGFSTQAAAGSLASRGQGAEPVTEEWHTYTATLVASPYQVAVGQEVEVAGTGYAPVASVEIVWHSVEGRYEIEGFSEFVGQRYEPVTAVVASAVADGQGGVRASFVVPLDFGGPHDIRGRVNGVEESQGGVMVLPTWSMSPAAGPVGTMIELRVVGIDLRTTMNTWHLLWDNHYFGLMTAVTTRGLGVARFRAAGPAGMHLIAAWNNSYQSAPYLAWDSSPFQDEFRSGIDFAFRVTEDQGPPPPEMDDFSADDNPWPFEVSGPGKLKLSADRGPVGQTTTLRGSGLPPSAHLPLIWTSVIGDRVTHVGIRELRRNAGEVRTGPDGTFAFDFKIPDDLGGSHRIEICRGAEVLAAAGFVITPSIVSFTQKVRPMEQIHVHLKGGGWTTYDNTYAVTYDNAYVGYACGLSTGGDMEFHFTATGAPGTHILDLYPTVYKGQDLMPRIYSLPMLTYASDHPVRKTPAIRLSIEVVE